MEILAARARSRLRRMDHLAALACAVVVFAVVVAAVGIGEIRHVSWAEGCGDDGSMYCGMAQGTVVLHPYSRRILLPLLIGLFHLSRELPTAFLVANLTFIAFTAAGTWLLARRLALSFGAPASRASSAGVIAAALLVVAPMGFRWTWFYPTLVDPPATAFLLAWVLLFADGRRRARWLSLVPAVLAVLSRESTAPVMLAGVVLAAVQWRDARRVALSAATTVLLLGATALVLALPGIATKTDSLYGYSTGLLGRYFGSRLGLAEVAWPVLFAVGLFPVLAAIAFPWRRRRDRQPALPLFLLTLVVATLAIGLVGGLDMDRFLFSVAPFIFSLAMAEVAARPQHDVDALLCLAASIIVWQPFRAVDGTRQGMAEFFSPQWVSLQAASHRLSGDMRAIALPLAAWVLLAAARRWIIRVPRGPSPAQL